MQLSEQEIIRRDKLKALRELGINPYPADLFPVKNTSKDIKENFEVDVLTLCFDVRNREETINELNAIPHEWKDVTVLVNNAGLAAGLSTIQDGDIDD